MVEELPSRYLDFDRESWRRLRASTPMTLSPKDLEALRGINERLSLDEVADVYLPLSRLLNVYMAATEQLHRASQMFLGDLPARVPYVIGMAGSVAAGKSTMARVLQALLRRWPDHPDVDLVTTDGFLYPNRVLDERNLMHRKGFPESYDRRRLLTFLAAVKAGVPELRVPVYSHVVYDIVAGAEQVVRTPDVLIVEGLNVLQTSPVRPTDLFVSDFFDFSIYVDADEADLQQWYIDRFFALRDTVFQDPDAYFHRYADLDDAEAEAEARRIWQEINGRNLREHILPTRERANLILEKGADHEVRRVRLQRL